MNILLLNPPGKKLYLRDYYCSKVSQADYLNQPIDLLYISGWLYGRHTFRVIDAIAESLKPDAIVAELQQNRYDAVIILVGAVSWDEDQLCIQTIKKTSNALIIATGDIFRENGSDRLREVPSLDAILLDFTSNDILRYLDQDYASIHTMLYRKNGEIVISPAVKKPVAPYELPIPRHELFMHKGYRHAFARTKPFTTILTDFGCPFQCTFCIMATLRFTCRTAANVLQELRYIRSLGIREIFWADQTFGVQRERNNGICRAMVEENLGLSWFTFSRVDVVDHSMLEHMKAAGCHTIIFGVESASEDILTRYKKGYTRDQIVQAFTWCRQLGIRTAATFLLGLPEETKESGMKTIQLAKELKCDFASFNVAVPRAGTALRKQAQQQNLYTGDTLIMDQSGTTVSMPTHALSISEVRALKRSAIISFYCRPGYLLKRLSEIRSWDYLVRYSINGWKLFINFLR